MPKVRRQRTKYHQSKADNAKEEDAPMDFGLADAVKAMEQADAPAAEISLENKTEEADEIVGKKNKRMNRRNQWLKKLGAIHSNQLEEKAAAKRRKTVVVGDVKPMCDALDDIAQILTEIDSSSDKADKKKQKQATTKVVSRNKRQMVLAEECKRFQSVLGNNATLLQYHEQKPA